MTDPSDRAWMRLALAHLFDQFTSQQAIALVGDPDALAAVLSAVNSQAAAAGVLPPPLDQRGQNLLSALVALRVKFPRPDAEARLDLNLRMRAGGA